MADADLDDFFAKKDKTKKKSKSKIKPDDILAQQSEKPKKKKKPKAPANPEREQQDKEKKKEDAEWEEVVEEETDYSGLRIQNLQVTNKEEGENEDEEGGGEGEEGEGKKEGGASGPWLNVHGEEMPAPAPAPQAMPEPSKAPEPQSTPLMAGKVQGGKYIPPARRGAGSASGGSGSGGSGSDNPIIVTSSAKRKPKVAPNLRSESDFPTLGGPTADSAGGAWQFEEVRSGGRKMEDPSKRQINLQLDNKFGALQDD